MAEDLLEKLNAIDPTVLTDVVRQNLNDPTFEITKWHVRRLSDKGVANPDGLWLFSGGGNGSQMRSWSVVLKILNRPPEELPPDNVWHWKREFSFAQSQLSKQLPGPVKTPCMYRTDEYPDGAWIWMEFVQGSVPDPWTLDEYAFAAYQLGLWNGYYLTGTSLPSEPWFTNQPYRSWLADMDFYQASQFPLTQKHIPKTTLARIEQLWNERETFFHTLENLPQVFSHFDSQKRNLFIRSNNANQKELVLLDWGQCGVGAIGAELTWLIGLTVALLEWPLIEVEKLEATAFHSYIQGLHANGWPGDTELVRLGFTSMFASYIGCALTSLLAWWCSPENSQFALQQFKLAEEELHTAWLPLVDYSLERADEARFLMKKLGFS